MLILDTYNVLHAAPRVDPGFAGLSLGGLVRLVQASRHRSGAVLVCDGTGTRAGLDDSLSHPDAPVRVVFAGPGKDADSLIERLIIEAERNGRAGQMTVVSSDKGVLASAIGPFGARPKRMTSEQFVRTLVADAAAHAGAGPQADGTDRPALDAESAARWLREFGVEGPPKQRTESIRSADGTGASPPSPASDSEEWPDGINPDDLDMEKWLGKMNP